MGKPGRKPMDIAGQRFGKLTAEKYVPNTKKGSYWLCSCDCGNSVVISLDNLKKGNTKSCGCLSKKGKPYGERPREKRNELSSTSKGRRRRADELCGKQFGRLTVLSFQGVNKNHHSVYLCRCSCGKTVSVVRNALTTGNTRSCGCFEVQGNYEPDNCRWTDAKTQSNNKRKSIRVVYGDKRISLYDWARIKGISLEEAKGMFSPNILENPPQLLEEKDDNVEKKKITKISDGMKIGYLTVLRPNGKDRYGHVVYLCRCVCGREKNVLVSNLRNGSVKSCGCMRKQLISKARTKHGDSIKSSPYYRLYRVWDDMIHQRRIESYEERELIPVCKDWSVWASFKEWSLANGYSKDKKLTRISYRKGYEPDNCVWRSEGEYVLHKF